MVTGYTIQVSQDGENWETLTSDTGNDQTWYTHVSSNIGEVLHYRFRARNSFSSGPWSGPASANFVMLDPDHVTSATDTRMLR